jgi:hypothetical protein
VLALARAVHADRARLLAEAAADRGATGSLLALALDELRPAARALDLARVPPDVVALLAELVRGER